MTWCPGCANELEDDGLICWPCSDKLADRVAQMPTMLATVEQLARRQLKAPSSSKVRGIPGPRLPIDAETMDVAIDVTYRLRSWTLELARHANPASHAQLGDNHLAWLERLIRRGVLRTAPFADDAWQEIDKDYELLRRTTKQRLRGEGKLVGLCNVCAGPVTQYDENDTQCTQCRETPTAVEARTAAFMAYSAANCTFTATQLAKMLSQPDRPLTLPTISKWKKSGKLPVVAISKDGTDRYDIIAALVLYETRIKLRVLSAPPPQTVAPAPSASSPG